MAYRNSLNHAEVIYKKEERARCLSREAWTENNEPGCVTPRSR